MTARLTDSLTGIGLAALLAVVGVGTERVYGEPDADVRTIATLEQRVSRLELIVSEGAGIHVEGGRAEVNVTIPENAQQRAIDERVQYRLSMRP